MSTISLAEREKSAMRAEENGNGKMAPLPKGLHVPEAPFRPGDSAHFDCFTALPGDLVRPDPLCHFEATIDHAYGLVRVLDDQGTAIGPWDPKIKNETVVRALETMILVRQLDSRMLMMQRQGRLSFYLESKGEEAVAVGAGLALRPTDVLFPYYRQQGLMLLREATLLDMICQCIGNTRDNTKGRQMPVHYSWKKGNIVSISSPVGTQFPQAVGAAMAAAYQKKDQVVAGWIGDGSAAEGDFHNAILFASVYKPPVLLNIVNNQWAISTHCRFATGGPTFASRGLSYGLPCLRVDGNDFLAVYAATTWAADRARRGGGPTVLELLTYRAAAHSSSDDPSRYRSTDEQKAWPGGDPIQRLTDHVLRGGICSQEDVRRMTAKAEQDVTAAYKEAETYGTLADGPYPSVKTLFEDVYEEIPRHLQMQRQELGK